MEIYTVFLLPSCIFSLSFFFIARDFIFQNVIEPNQIDCGNARIEQMRMQWTTEFSIWVHGLQENIDDSEFSLVFTRVLLRAGKWVISKLRIPFINWTAIKKNQYKYDTLIQVVFVVRLFVDLLESLKP